VTYCLRSGGGSGGFPGETGDSGADVGHLVGRSREARLSLAQAILETSPLVLARAREVADLALEMEVVIERFLMFQEHEAADE
jgi:hypothetical protein